MHNYYVDEPSASWPNDQRMTSDVCPPVPPRTHPVHQRNRELRGNDFLNVFDCIPRDDSVTCRSRHSSSVGFVDIDDLKKLQKEEENERSSCPDFLRGMLFERPSKSRSWHESHINAGYQGSLVSTRSFTKLPQRPKRSSALRRFFSCFAFLNK